MTPSNIVDFPQRGQLVAWPGKSVRESHAALLRAERTHNKTQALEDWQEVCRWRDEYILACRTEGVEP